MSLQESIEKRLKERQEELQKQKKFLGDLNAGLQKVNQDIRNTQDMIHLISGAVHELLETKKSLDAHVEEKP